MVWYVYLKFPRVTHLQFGQQILNCTRRVTLLFCAGRDKPDCSQPTTMGKKKGKKGKRGDDDDW
jgi:hypothetical protein